MSKTPEEMAEEYTKDWWGNLPEAEGMRKSARENFLAGYKAAMNENKPKVQELEANWKFCCEDKARLLNELAAAERAKEQVADVSKVMPQWISVKDRLPEMNKLCIVNTEWRGVVPATYGNESWIFDDGQGWSEKALSYASYWMELPAPPKEEK